MSQDHVDLGVRGQNPLIRLLLPLSFLLIARLSNVYYLLALNFYTSPQSSSYIFSLFLDTNPILLHALVSVVTMATFVHGLTGSMFLLGKPDHVSILRPRLYVAWILLCALQVCVGLGVEGSIAAGIDGINIKDGRISLVSRVVFFLGLHETMIQWCRMIVKPVVDDTVFGGAREEEEERVVEKVAVAASCGALWWWKLRDEVESMVTVAEVKKEMGLDMRVADLAGWWLYYVTVSIGVVKIVKGLMRLGMILRQGRSHPHPGPAPAINPICDLVDKV
uniref:Uncharacterized protein n=1 Tax=Kalanchoe fedtschenkoi TaxID=63787 RepID=A0A7N0TT22_KALFE